MILRNLPYYFTSAKSKNFKNVAKTLSEKHQRITADYWNNFKTENNLKYGKKEINIISHLNNFEIILENHNNIGKNDAVETFKQVTLNNVCYKSRPFYLF